MEVGRKNKAPMVRAGIGGKIALCVIGRRENRYARKYVSHYKNCGFDKIFLCDNNRGDEERFDTVLGDWIEDGFVEILNYRDKAGVQRDAYEEVYARYGSKYRWMAFFDFDEFLTIPCGKAQGTAADFDVHELMRNYDGYDCVLFNWQCYGENGLVRDDGRDLRERFTEPLPFDLSVQYAGMPENDHVKCVVRGGLPRVQFYLNPHVPSNRMRCCDSCGEPCEQKAFHKYDFSVAYLRHYITKTAEEWFSNKWQKGTGNKENIEAFRSKYAERFFKYNEWTQEKDAVMRLCTGMPPKEVPDKKTVVIVNFNTTDLTVAAIRSLNKHTPGCKVVVFDNSDKEAFLSGKPKDADELLGNVDVIDNTKGQLIDFEQFLAEYPDKYPTPENNWGSAKHCKTIDYCMDLFPEGFLLMDSDVLVRKDVTPFFDSSYAWSGLVDLHRNRWNYKLPRVLPYLCYINVPLLKANGVRYFNGEKMWALSHRHPDMWYDTGCWFYEACHGFSLPENHLNIDDYILHLRHGSWNACEAGEWLEANRELWE